MPQTSTTRAVGRLRVLLVSQCYAESGLRRQVEAFASRFEVRFVTPRRAVVLVFPDYRTASDPRTNTVAYPRLSLFGEQYCLLTPSLGIRSFQPDLIYVTYDPWSAIYWQVLTAASVFAPNALIVSGIKKNTYRRYPGLRGTVKDTIARSGLRRVDHFVAASAMTAQMYKRLFGVADADVSVATRVGVDIGVFSPRANGPIESGRVVAGYCGRLSEHKGVLDLVEAVSIARARGVEIELELLGAGELRDQLLARSRSDRWVTVHDAVPSDRVADFMRRLDLYVLPARVLPDHEEHDAHALLQALACGLPAIGTRSGIIPEILAGPDDLLVEPDDPGGLASALVELVADPHRRARQAAQGRRAAEEKYSLERVADAHAEIFTKLLSGARS